MYVMVMTMLLMMMMMMMMMCSGRAALLSLSHASIQTAVHQRYIKSLGSDQESSLHRLIAGISHFIIHASLIAWDLCSWLIFLPVEPSAYVVFWNLGSTPPIWALRRKCVVTCHLSAVCTVGEAVFNDNNKNWWSLWYNLWKICEI